MLWASPVGRLMCLVYRQEIMEMTIEKLELETRLPMHKPIRRATSCLSAKPATCSSAERPNATVEPRR